MNFLNHQHLLVKFGEELCGCIVNENINLPSQLVICNRLGTSQIDIIIDTIVGTCDMEIKGDGIYYTPKLFEKYNLYSEIVEKERRDVLKICGKGDGKTLDSITYFYLSDGIIKNSELLIDISMFPVK